MLLYHRLIRDVKSTVLSSGHVCWTAIFYLVGISQRKFTEVIDPHLNLWSIMKKWVEKSFSRQWNKKTWDFGHGGRDQTPPGTAKWFKKATNKQLLSSKPHRLEFESALDFILYYPVMWSHFLHSLGNYTRRAIFPEMCKINQSIKRSPFGWLLDWRKVNFARFSLGDNFVNYLLCSTSSALPPLLYEPYYLVVWSHFLHSLGNYTPRAIFPEMCKINQSIKHSPLGWLLDWR